MDSIQIRDLEIYCHHGVLKEENILGQKFLISVVLYMNTRPAGQTDELDQSVNYASVAHVIKEEMQRKNYHLIEAAAEHLAQQILLRFPLTDRIEVEVKKPWAPIQLPLDTVSVCIEREWTTVYLSLGSNMGDRRQYIENAVKSLREEPDIKCVRVSDLIETEPYGYTDQEKFLNAAVELRTLKDPEQMLEKCRQIEKEGHRERSIHWGPRTIDVDILLYDDLVVQTDELTIPHREMHKRRFVLEPLAQLAPWAGHPVYGKKVIELLEKLEETDTHGGEE